MNEPRLGPCWKFGCALALLVLSAFAGWIAVTGYAVSHDKSLNSRFERLWLDPAGVPLGVVIPANNHWMENAFVADVSREDGKKVAVMILDAHYISGDGTLRSESGVIGDTMSRRVLCSLPVQAQEKGVTLDNAVKRLVKSECGRKG